MPSCPLGPGPECDLSEIHLKSAANSLLTLPAFAKVSVKSGMVQGPFRALAHSAPWFRSYPEDVK